MKINNSEERVIETRTRNFKSINYETINNNIIENKIYDQLLRSEDPEFITDNLIRIINEELDNQAPINKTRRLRS